MNFCDLLDDQEQATRELDVWIGKNIAGYNVAVDHTINKDSDGLVPRYQIGDPPRTPLPKYTTRDSFQDIWQLAKEYLDEIDMYYGFYLNSFMVNQGNECFECQIETGMDENNNPKSNIIGRSDESENIAIAEVLFKIKMEVDFNE